MWTADNRPRLRPSEPLGAYRLIPPGKPGGGKRRVREVINGVMYILHSGARWDLPPRSRVHDYLGLWNWDGTLVACRDCGLHHRQSGG